MSEEDVAAALRELLATIDRVPRAALQAANSALAWRNLEAELARLTAEAGLSSSALRGGEPRLLTFRTGQTIIEVEVSSDGGAARLLGQLDPPRSAAVTVESAARSLTTRADGHGRFSADGLVPGWMRVVVAAAGSDGGSTATEWFRA
jgi:hypothetical protein